MPTTTTVSHTELTPTSSATTTTVTTPPQPVAVIDLILGDVNALLPNFNGLVSSYRLLVGAAEEIRRTRDVCPDVFERAVRRFDNAGTLIDVLLELLCCKIVFSADLLKVTCGPVDLVRYLLTCLDGQDTPCRSAETVAGLAALRRLQDCLCGGPPCLPDDPVVCAAPPPVPPPISPPPLPPIVEDSDIADVVETAVITGLSNPGLLGNKTASSVVEEALETITDLQAVSRLRRRHREESAPANRKNTGRILSASGRKPPPTSSR